MGNKCYKNNDIIYNIIYSDKYVKKHCKTLDQLPDDIIELKIHKTNIKRITNIKRFTKIKYLEITDNNLLEEIEDLQHMVTLQHLICYNNPKLKTLPNINDYIFLYTYKIS